MDSNNNVDNSSQLGYNDITNDGHEIVVDTVNIPPINDVTCEHTELIPDFEDTIGDAVYYGCKNQKCGLGWYVRPQ
jgi:hypothetical protein